MSDAKRTDMREFRRALLLFMDGSLEEAGRVCRIVLDTEPNHFNSLHLLGLIEAHRGCARDAYHWFSRAIAANSGVASAHQNLGNTLCKLKRFSDAIASYDKALAFNTANAEAHFCRGNALIELRQFEEAAKSYEAAISHKPTFSEAMNGHGNSMLMLKRYEEALAGYERALKITPDYAEARLNHGVLLHVLGRLEEALSDCAEVLRIKPGDAAAQAERSALPDKLDKVDRIVILQRLADALRAEHYLEIGVSEGQSFFPLRISHKVAVEPNPGVGWRTHPSTIPSDPWNSSNEYHQMTSDEFFARIAPPAESFDLVFIDGLHTYEQALRDALHALGAIRPRGVVVLHDCNPPHAAAATPARSYDDAAAMKLPGWTGEWCGDVWKAIIHLRATRQDLEIAVLDCDYGVGLVRKAPASTPLVEDIATLENWSYERLLAQRVRLLNLQPPRHLETWLYAARNTVD